MVAAACPAAAAAPDNYDEAVEEALQNGVKDTIDGTDLSSMEEIFDQYGNVFDGSSMEDAVEDIAANGFDLSEEEALEALKAQAVAARTYAMKRIEEGKKKKFPEHRGADLCSNPSHCQAWNSKETLMNNWGITSYMSNLKKVTNAVEETQGLVITYNGQLIDAVYHSSCGGFTEDSGNVWVSQVPYLVAVECNYEQANNKLKETKTWSASSLKSIFGIGQWAVAVSASADVMNKAKMADPGTVQVIDATDSDRARYVSIFGTLIDAKVVRQKLGLKSTKIQVNNLPGSVEFTTYGYGHGVGMCQYGANGMASAGMTFDQILHHYYTGVQISVAVAGK